MSHVPETVARARAFLAGGWSADDVVRFHSGHKLLLLAHSPDHYRQLGRLVAVVTTMPRGEFRQQYLELFETAVAREPTRGTHVNVLEHVLGYFRGQVAPSVYTELRDALARYAAGETSLRVPIQLLEREIERGGIDYLAQQRYFSAFRSEGEATGPQHL